MGQARTRPRRCSGSYGVADRLDPVPRATTGADRTPFAEAFAHLGCANARLARSRRSAERPLVGDCSVPVGGGDRGCVLVLAIASKQDRAHTCATPCWLAQGPRGLAFIDADLLATLERRGTDVSPEYPIAPQLATRSGAAPELPCTPYDDLSRHDRLAQPSRDSEVVPGLVEL
jgi:hypothetical protein